MRQGRQRLAGKPAAYWSTGRNDTDSLHGTGGQVQGKYAQFSSQAQRQNVRIVYSYVATSASENRYANGSASSGSEVTVRFAVWRRYPETQAAHLRKRRKTTTGSRPRNLPKGLTGTKESLLRVDPV
ncbi:hypothetical protein D6445_23660 [Salmonella enterica subsp. enterica serovar Infantis]|nr:hypothetical protein [Salmonella enterica subsp. enterica serovar Infantis]